jgi:hypothetical protein
MDTRIWKVHYHVSRSKTLNPCKFQFQPVHTHTHTGNVYRLKVSTCCELRTNSWNKESSQGGPSQSQLCCFKHESTQRMGHPQDSPWNTKEHTERQISNSSIYVPPVHHTSRIPTHEWVREKLTSTVLWQTLPKPTHQLKFLDRPQQTKLIATLHTQVQVLATIPCTQFQVLATVPCTQFQDLATVPCTQFQVPATVPCTQFQDLASRPYAHKLRKYWHYCEVLPPLGDSHPP